MGGVISYVPYYRHSAHKRKYGWRRKQNYYNDSCYNFKISKNLQNIKRVDLRDTCSTIPVYDQGHLGSCTANAISFAYKYDEIKQKETSIIDPSRLFIYYNEREMEGHIDQDVGGAIKDGILSIHTKGICSEILWPYNITKFKDTPTQECYDSALKHISIEYKRLDGTNIDQLKQCLLEGFPFVFGFMVYESFETNEVASTGIMPIPKDGEKLLGGHAVAACGYCDDMQAFLIRNSWGGSWIFLDAVFIHV